MIVCIAAGCYDARQFQSTTGTMLHQDGWSSPEYRVMFEPMVVQTSASAEHAFCNPPPEELHVALDFPSGDISLISQHGGYAKVVISDAKGQVVFAAEGELDPDVHYADTQDNYQWRAISVVSMQPTLPVWRKNATGRVLEAGTVRLGSGEYKLNVEITVKDRLEQPVNVHPLLVGGFRSVL